MSNNIITGKIIKSTEITGKIHGEMTSINVGNYLFPTGFWNNALTWLNTKYWKNNP